MAIEVHFHEAQAETKTADALTQKVEALEKALTQVAQVTQSLIEQMTTLAEKVEGQTSTPVAEVAQRVEAIYNEIIRRTTPTIETVPFDPEPATE